MSRRLPLHKALLIIGISIASCVAIAGGIYYFNTVRLYRLRTDPQFTIKKLIHSTPSKEKLRTEYLAELLGLSVDAPQSLIDFDVAKAAKRLTESPVIKKAHVRKRGDDSLVVRYEMRTPIARFGNVFNGGIDEEGVIFPLSPFFTPKKLPEIYISAHAIAFGKHLPSQEWTIAKTLLQAINDDPSIYDLQVEHIDVSTFKAPSLGKRSIAIVIKNPNSKHYVRLHHKTYLESLANYIELRKELLFQERDGDSFEEKIIDMRIANYAYVKPVAI